MILKFKQLIHTLYKMKQIIFISFFLSLLFVPSYTVIPASCDASITVNSIDICIRCRIGFVVSGSGTVCLPEIDQCYEYVDENKALCKTCAQNYIRSNSGKACIRPIPNCLVHLDGGGGEEAGPATYKKCAQCATGFSPTVQGKACVKSIPNCNRYNSNGNCTEIKGCKTYDYSPIALGIYGTLACRECYEDLVLSASALFCVPIIMGCIPPGYEDDGSCRTCGGGMSSSTTRRSCFTKDGTCAEINDVGICTKCLDPTTIPVVNKLADCANTICSNRCVAPKAGCVLYADDGKCIKCNSNSLVLTAEGYCFNNIPQCATYDTDGSCKTCISPNYALDKALALKPTGCLAVVTNCATYDPKGYGICLTCKANFQRVVTEFVSNVPKTAVCVAIDQYCIKYDGRGCVICQALYDVYNGACYSSIPQCASYTFEIGCTECRTGYVGLAGNGVIAPANVPIVKCGPQITDCSVYNPISFLCKACATATNHVSGSSKTCVKIIPDCAKFDDKRNICAECTSPKVLYKSGKLCGDALAGAGATCVFLDDADPTKCVQCPDGKILSNDRLTCIDDPTSTAPVAPLAYLYKPGQILWATKTATYCLTHPFGSGMSGVSLIDTTVAAKFSDIKEPSFKNCDEVDYRDTLWQVLKDTGVMLDKATAFIPDDSTGISVSFAAYYSPIAAVANENAFPTKTANGDKTKLQIRLNAPSGTSLALATDNFAIFTLKLNKPSSVQTGQDIFNNQFNMKIKGTTGWNIPAAGTDTVGTIGSDAASNTITTNYVSYTGTGKYYLSSSVTSSTTGWLDFRQVNLDATASSTTAAPTVAKPFDLVNQVAMTYTFVDDYINFQWNVAATITDLNNIFPVVQGEASVINSDRTAISSVCNYRFNCDAVGSGWSKSYAAVASDWDTNTGEVKVPTGHMKISLNILVFDLVTKCGFKYETLGTELKATDSPLGLIIGAMDKGSSYLKGKIGYYAGSTITGVGATLSTNNGDGLFKTFYIKLNTMKAERGLYIDNPLSYQWYNSGTVVQANLKFNTQIRFFTGSTELQGVANYKDPRGLVVPLTGTGAISNLKAKLTLLSSVKNDQIYPDLSSDLLDPNIRVYKDLTENFTFTSINVKLAKTTSDTGTATKYATSINSYATITMSTTERNTAYFDVDMAHVISGKYSVIVEYQIKPPDSRTKYGRRLLTEDEEKPETKQTPDINQVNENVSGEELIGFSGHVAPFTLEFQSKFGSKMSILFGLIILILGMMI